MRGECGSRRGEGEGMENALRLVRLSVKGGLLCFDIIHWCATDCYFL